MTSIVFDLETGGLAESAPIIQLAAVAVDESSWQELAAMECKILFVESEAEAEALKLNHYDRETWQRLGIPAMTACQRFADFIAPYRSLEMVSKRTGRPYGVARLIGHNAATFDGPRLGRMFRENGLFLPADPRVRCTVQMAMAYCDARNVQPPSYRLADLMTFFGLPLADNAHDALADVRMTVALLRHLRTAARQAVAA